MMNSKIEKLIIFVLLIAMFVGVFSFSATALQVENYDFANFSETDSMAFVEEHNIEIPTISFR